MRARKTAGQLPSGGSSNFNFLAARRLATFDHEPGQLSHECVKPNTFALFVTGTHAEQLIAIAAHVEQLEPGLVESSVSEFRQQCFVGFKECFFSGHEHLVLPEFVENLLFLCLSHRCLLLFGDNRYAQSSGYANRFHYRG